MVAIIKFRAPHSFITLETQCPYSEKNACEAELIELGYTIVCSYKKYC